MKSLLTIVIAISGLSINQRDVICTSSESCSLLGRPKVLVMVEDIPKDLKGAGISSGQLKTEVELLLRQSGISVTTTVDGTIHLIVTVNGFETILGNDKTEGFVFIVNVEVWQMVRLHRLTPVIVTGATTWRTATGYGFSPKRPSARDYITRQVTIRTKQFINAYLEANPK